MKQVVLLGDSIFDNQLYVGADGKSVSTYLEEIGGGEYRFHLAAVDGSGIRDVMHQIESIPDNNERAFVSAGGNDITRHINYLQQPAETVAEVLLTFREYVDEFAAAYSALVHKLTDLEVPVTLCTIYNCHFPNETGQRCIETALALFNDAIIQTAYRHAIPYIDLRHVCTEPSDFVNEIEPSDSGGRKIAEAVFAAL